MKLWRHRPERELNRGFAWREIVCGSEPAAKAEAERQQLLDDDDVAEWIYLRSDKTGQWLARRTPRQLDGRASSWSPEAWSWINWPGS